LGGGVTGPSGGVVVGFCMGCFLQEVRAITAKQQHKIPSSLVLVDIIYFLQLVGDTKLVSVKDITTA
jgi:hypothetical protein